MKYATHFTFILAMLLAGSIGVHAQDGEAFIEQTDNPGITHNEAVTEFTGQYISGGAGLAGNGIPIPLSAFNEAILTQTGNFNTGHIEQFGYGNKAILTQKGNRSTGIIRLYGLQNEARIIQHSNSWLKATLGGATNKLDFEQPSNSSVLFQITGINNRFDAVQHGNSVSLYEDGAGGSPYMTISKTSGTIPVIVNRINF
ncbi:MAG: hypothetical protein U5K31_00465 [Balneolaceae bacterium]|nr:hypothetical protein [Balneolaceae bacterium]